MPLLHPTPHSLHPRCPTPLHVARQLSSPVAKSDVRKEKRANGRFDPSDHNCLAAAVAGRAVRDLQLARAPATTTADKTQTRFALRCDRFRESIAGAPPTRPTTLPHLFGSK